MLPPVVSLYWLCLSNIIYVHNALVFLALYALLPCLAGSNVNHLTNNILFQSVAYSGNKDKALLDSPAEPAPNPQLSI